MFCVLRVQVALSQTAVLDYQIIMVNVVRQDLVNIGLLVVLWLRIDRWLEIKIALGQIHTQDLMVANLDEVIRVGNRIDDIVSLALECCVQYAANFSLDTRETGEVPGHPWWFYWWSALILISFHASFWCPVLSCEAPYPSYLKFLQFRASRRNTLALRGESKKKKKQQNELEAHHFVRHQAISQFLDHQIRIAHLLGHFPSKDFTARLWFNSLHSSKNKEFATTKKIW